MTKRVGPAGSVPMSDPTPDPAAHDRAGASPTISPMFPLGSVLLPSAVLPLHVFEPRYREMIRTCLDGNGQFGVALIERGSEVGGGDVRADVGTLAAIAEAQELEDGRWAVIAVGTGRIRVHRWLPDDPYPRAEIEAWPEPAVAHSLADRYAELVTSLRRVLALASELGDAVADAGSELSDDPVVGSYQVAVLAPLGPLDRQRVLLAEDAAARIDVVEELIGELDATLQARLALG